GGDERQHDGDPQAPQRVRGQGQAPADGLQRGLVGGGLGAQPGGVALGLALLGDTGGGGGHRPSSLVASGSSAVGSSAPGSSAGGSSAPGPSAGGSADGSSAGSSADGRPSSASGSVNGPERSMAPVSVSSRRYWPEPWRSTASATVRARWAGTATEGSGPSLGGGPEDSSRLWLMAASS